MRFPLLLFCSILFVTQAAPDSIAQVDHATRVVTQLAEEFAAAVASGNAAVLPAMVHPEASCFASKGGEAKNLLKSLKKQIAKQKLKPVPATKRTTHREVQVVGATAVVTEFIAAVAEIPAGKRVSPIRQTIVWTRTGDVWRITHAHSSSYTKWDKSIAAFEAQQASAQQASAAGGVVFVGSSSIRGWKTLHDDFAGTHVIGRGFGGSQLIDSIAFAHRIVTPYKPRAVAVYAGDNDVANGKSAKRVFADFRMLVDTIHAQTPDARIGFIAIKPSLKRWEMWPTMQAANDMVAEYASQHDGVDFLDIATPMLGADGKPKPELFVKDGLHMTRAGYVAWTAVVKPWIEQE